MTEKITTANSQTIGTLQECLNGCIAVCEKYKCNSLSAMTILGKMMCRIPFLLNEDWNDDVNNAKVFYNWRVYTMAEIKELPKKERDWIIDQLKTWGLF